MSYVKRQELFRDVNPLLKKYKYEGPLPPSYIPPKKRKIISRYMGRSSFSPGFYVAAEDAEFGHQTTKMGAEKSAKKNADYKDAVHERIQSGKVVKTFQNAQRIQYGRLDAAEPKQRQRISPDTEPLESYDKLVQQRDTIRHNTNKVNCFTNENEPAFINSMSRTMDAFDVRMSTFGGKNADKATKKKNFDKFIAEKRGFIRTTNQFYNQDPYTIIRQEKNQIVQRPGPAIQVNYDNKYKANTSFATDEGRYKQELNVNQHDEAALKGAEKAQLLEALKQTNIKFDLDERGVSLVREHNRQQSDRQDLTSRDYPTMKNEERLPMRTIGEERESQEYGPDYDVEKKKQSVFTSGKHSVSFNETARTTDYDSGAPRSRTSQRKRDSRGGSVPAESLHGGGKWPAYADHLTASPTSHYKTMSGKQKSSRAARSKEGGILKPAALRTSARGRPYPSELSDGPRPYELWQKQMVSKSGAVRLGKHRDFKLGCDQSSKAHLTTAKGGPNAADYTPIARVYHGKQLSVDPAHLDIDEGIHRLMKTTTYTIGKQGEDAPNEVNTTNQTQLTQKVHAGEDPPKVDKNSRRCDPENPNRAKAVGFGYGSEKGTHVHQVVHRSKTFYGDVYHPAKRPFMPPDVTKQINDSRKEFQLHNKFEYGYDSKGGARANPPLDADSPTKIKECLEQSAAGHAQREEFKEHIERQNFTIQHDKELANTDTKHIGTHQGQGIDNVIDQEDLKRSHVPIPSTRNDRLQILRSFYGSTNGTVGQTKTREQVRNIHKDYSAFKTGSEESKVPFSQTRRNRLERTYDKFDKVNGYGASVNTATFGWKVPTYDLK